MAFSLESQINYDETLHDRAGKVELTNDTLAEEGKTLLRLMYWALYTAEGRKLLDGHKNIDPKTGSLTSQDRDVLIAAFAARGVTNQPLCDAIIDAHVAATLWVAARTQGNEEAQKQAEFVYLQKMSFVTWCLFEDFKSNEFSLLW
jgi:hypothetical protein